MMDDKTKNLMQANVMWCEGEAKDLIRKFNNRIPVQYSDGFFVALLNCITNNYIESKKRESQNDRRN